MQLIKRTTAYKPGLFYISAFAAVWAIFLLYAGAYTTSIQAGMAFLDWPLSNSSINPDGWLTHEDMRAEHSHRLLGAKLGLISIGLVILTQLREGRRWVRNLAIGLFAMVVFQGLLGGMRVLFDTLNTGSENNLVAQTFAVLHACGAELTICLIVTLCAATSKAWMNPSGKKPFTLPTSFRTWGLIATLTIFVQIIIGAIMRHAGAGLAIPTFPLSPDGSLLPPNWSFAMTVHWLHRAGAIVTTIAILIFTGKILGSRMMKQRFSILTGVIFFLLGLQILLGVATILTQKNPVMASTHMLVGAFLLGATWMLTFFTFQVPIQSVGNKMVNKPLKRTEIETTTA